MLWVGLTGGIGAGKSAVSRLLVQQGAALVDADRVAREVLEPGTPGLTAVVEAFGPQVLLPDGALDRAALGAVVFAEEEARTRLNGIVHPLIGRRTAVLAQEAESGGADVLVHDVPLLVESGLAPGYHVVLVVEAPVEERLRRLVRLRGMTESDARARIASQADDSARREVADVVLDNRAGLEDLHQHVREVWGERIRPYAENLARGRATTEGPVRLCPHDPDWLRQGRRLVARLQHVCGTSAVRVEHVGSTAVPALDAEDVIDLQVEVRSRQDGEDLAPLLRSAGFPRREDVHGDPPRPELDPDPARDWKRLHRSSDPARPALVHVRQAGSAAARAAPALRDLLRADGSTRARYAADKHRLAALHAEDAEAYAEAKTPLLVPLLVRALGNRPPG